MADLQLTASPRTLTGRKVRQLRNRNLIPVVLYGKRVPSEALQVEERSLERVLHSGGMSRLVELEIDGSRTHNALIRNVQRHPVSHRLSHADFYAVDMREKQYVNVVVEATGKPEGLAGGLIILQVMDHVEIEALPADIPAKIVVDITPMTLERPITVADLPAIAGVSYQAEPDEHVFTLSITRAEVEAEAEAAAAAEPEVVGSKGKKEEDEE